MAKNKQQKHGIPAWRLIPGTPVQRTVPSIFSVTEPSTSGAFDSSTLAVMDAVPSSVSGDSGKTEPEDSIRNCSAILYR